ncbi:TIR domain-containing protein [uncultured Bacteroides sp.]|uniref:TIR domain-containing protein n=1 Tax=uncultured Bacteroides sp. TaxID=162156 RepID=UPI0025E6ACC1|nr:TIR domain-containing protein [uncultured Bacteroides sp.]
MVEKKEIKNIFVSHYHMDEEGIKNLKTLLSNDYCIKNFSVTSDKFNNAKNEDYIKYGYLKPLINQSSTLVCLIGPNTHDSKWVDWEIREAEKLGKQIIGVFIQGARDSDIPPALEEFADAIVGWNTDNIKKALSGESFFVKSDGSPRTSVTKGRGVC